MSLKGQKTTATSIDWEKCKSLIGKLERDKDYKFCLLITIGVFTVRPPKFWTILIINEFSRIFLINIQFITH